MERRQAAEPRKGGTSGSGKDRAKKELPAEDDAEDEEEEQVAGQVLVAVSASGGGGGDEDKKKRPSSSSSTTYAAAAAAAAARRGGGGGSGGGSLSQPCCQAEKCTADLSDAKRYHRRHKVCELHSKAAVVMVAGLRQRFCQQCSRFHELSEFDEAKRSCRRRLAGHNERRRKSSSESQGEGSNRCRQVDQSGRMQITLPGNPTYKHFQIR